MAVATAASRPDEGYAWIVVASCAFIQFALFGIYRSAGLLYVAILHTFGVSREIASWPFTMCSATSDMSGLIMSLLTRFMSIRKVAVIGSVIATLGIALCHQAESMMWINVCFGFIHGIGVGIVTALIPIVIDRYFRTHKTTALGLSFSGVSGLFLMLSGVVMNTLVASSLMRDPPWLSETKDPYEQVEYATKIGSVDGALGRSEKYIETEEFERSQPPKDCLRPLYLPETSAVPPDLNTSYFSRVRLNSERYNSLPSLSIKSPDSLLTNRRELSHIAIEYSEMKSDIENEGNLSEATGDSVTPLFPLNECPTEYGQPSSTMANAFASIKTLLERPTFYIIAFSSAVFSLLFISFLVVIVDYAVDEGVDEISSMYIMSTFSLIDMFGRCGLGWLVDRGFIKSRNQFVINSIAIGLMFQIYPFASNLFHFCAIAAIHGLFSGSSMTLLYILQAEFAGTNQMSLIVGLVHFCNGMVSFARPPIIGIFRDVIGSYDWMFRSMGFLSFLVAALWLLEAWAKKKSGNFKARSDPEEAVYEQS